MTFNDYNLGAILPLYSLLPLNIRKLRVQSVRAFCGRATETGASLVALDNNLATTIDSTYPGMGIVQSGGKNEFIRYYFSKFEDLEEYYQQRGLDELGYSPIDSEFSGNSQLEDLDGEIEITVNRDKSKYEFEKNSVEIDNREEQDWREV